jgi:sugar transferase (PEP-CTERM/EpsH1 system associated)
MRLLFLTPQLPYPPHKGTSLRNFNLIKNLAPNHEIHLLSFIPEGGETAEASPLQSFCASIQTVPAPRRSLRQRLRSLAFSPLPDIALRLPSALFATKLKAYLESTQFDAVQVEGLELARYYLITSPEQASFPAIILDEHNAEYVLQQRAFEVDSHSPRRWVGTAYSLVQWQKLKRYERRACRRATAIVAVSEADRRALLQLDPDLDIAVVPNGVDTEYFRCRPLAQTNDKESSATLVFTGTMDFRPNVDAMTWFCKEILPLIRSRTPKIRLFIVGQGPAKAVQELASPFVTVTGAVEDIRPYLENAAVYVVPMRMGGGVRLKVLEAMASGIPVVSTRAGVEGIDVEEGENALLADTAMEFAAKVVDALTNASLRNRLARQGRKLVEDHYDWRLITPKLEELYLRLKAKCTA